MGNNARHALLVIYKFFFQINLFLRTCYTIRRALTYILLFIRCNILLMLLQSGIWLHHIDKSINGTNTIATKYGKRVYFIRKIYGKRRNSRNKNLTGSAATNVYGKLTGVSKTTVYRNLRDFPKLPKIEFHIQLAVIRDYFRFPVQTSILACRQISQVALTSISRDCALIIDASSRVSETVHENGSRTRVAIYSNLEQYQNGNYFFRQHQVVNHSLSYVGRDTVLGNNTIEMINTNMIEGVWRDMKLKIDKRNYTVSNLPGKLMEYLWRRANKYNIKAGMERCLKEISFNNDIASRVIENDDTGIITRGENGNPPEVEVAYQARAAIRRAADLRRYLARNRRTNTGYEEDVARVMLGRAYEDQRRSSNVTGSESDESSSNDSDFSFGDSDLDYDFENTTSINVPPHDHASTTVTHKTVRMF
ncbi:hypothetical protein EDC94DRAFT_591125 [Helicostylum pulchrum]|nr:hypothetical protein EDC94DRAFT_591125 [Helicostylum pulchrum]